MHTPARPIGRVFGSVFLLLLLLFSSLSASQGGVRAAPQATTVGVAGPSAALAATPGDNLGPRSLVPTAAGILSAGSLPGLHAHPAGFERQLGVLATITVGSFPTAALVDPRNGEKCTSRIRGAPECICSTTRRESREFRWVRGRSARSSTPRMGSFT